MKRILIAVDFSDNANEAAHYAIQFGKSIGINNFIFHNSFMLNTIELDMVSVDPMQQIHMTNALMEQNMDFDPEQIKQSAINRIDELIISLKEKYGTFESSIHVLPGDLIDNIEELVDEEHASYVIMGITGRGKFAQKLIGSNTMRVVQEVDVPVIVVPSHVQFMPIKDIALAIPMQHLKKMDYPWHLMHDTFKEINANVNVVSVSKELSTPNMELLINENKVMQQFGDLSTAIYYYENKDITDGLLLFSDELSVQMISTVAGEHNLIAKWFKPSITETLAYKSNLPILIFKED